MSTILITGGTGLIGTAVTRKLLAQGHEVIILSRTTKSSSEKKVSYAVWNIKTQTIDANAIAVADFIIHLAGAGIADKRWTEDRKKEIVESRTESSKLLIKGLEQVPNKVKAVISMSGIGWYGADEKDKSNKKGYTEDRVAGTGFLGDTCRRWEESINPVEKLGKRLVKFRLGIVLSNDGGALAEFKKPIRFGIAAVLGSGRQIISWIHIEDLCRLMIYAIKNETLQGVYNAVAPAPVTNKELTLALAEKMRGRFFVPLHVPAFVIKLLFGQLSVEVLKSTTVSGQKLQSAGFDFLYYTRNAALDDLIKK